MEDSTIAHCSDDKCVRPCTFKANISNKIHLFAADWTMPVQLQGERRARRLAFGARLELMSSFVGLTAALTFQGAVPSLKFFHS